MNDQQIRDYATDLIKEQAAEVDYLGIFEVFEEWGPKHDMGDELAEDDGKKVADLMGRAVITVTFRDPA